MPIKRQFLMDERGKKVAVVLSIRAYKRLLECIEDLEDIRAYDEAKASGETGVPLEEAFARIERFR